MALAMFYLAEIAEAHFGGAHSNRSPGVRGAG